MLVSAPAGFGKTTLLTEWLAAGPTVPNDERLVAWLSLDRADNDRASFWTYVIAALQTVAPGIGGRALELLQASHPPPIETVLTALLNDLGAMASDIVLGLDDFHVIDGRDVQDAMAFLLVAPIFVWELRLVTTWSSRDSGPRPSQPAWSRRRPPTSTSSPDVHEVRPHQGVGAGDLRRNT